MSQDKTVSKSGKSSLAAFEALCRMLDENEWHYDKNEQDLCIDCGAQGDDLPMDIRIKIYPEFELISLISTMPFTVPENRRKELAVAVSRANDGIVDGSFDYNYKTGRLLFRMTSSFMGGLVGKELFAYMLFVSCKTIDEYNDKFFMLCKNNMTADEIVDTIK